MWEKQNTRQQCNEDYQILCFKCLFEYNFSDWVITRFTEDRSRSLTRLSALLPSADTFHILWAVAFALLFHFTSPSVDVLVHHPLIHTYFHIVILISLQLSNPVINVKNFHGSLTTFVRAQNDTSKTANITNTIFDRTLVTSDGVLKIGQIRRFVSC